MLRERGGIRENPVAILDRGMARDANLCPLLERRLIHTDPTGPAPTIAISVFARIFEHKFRMNELAGRSGGLPVLKLRVFPNDLSKNCVVRPRIRTSRSGSSDCYFITENDPNRIIVRSV
jgi:hypothetical protein